MRLIDRRLGIPMCFGLTMVRRVASMAGPRREGPIERVLFVKLAEQGSTVLAVSALRRAIDRVGRENVYFMCFEENRFILDLMDLIPEENVIPIRTEGAVRTLLRCVRAAARARSIRPDACVDMEFFTRSSAIMTFLSGAPRRVGFHPCGEEGPYRGDLMTHRLRFSPHMHTSEVFRFMVDAMDLDVSSLPAIPFAPGVVDEDPPPFVPSDDEAARVRGIIAAEAGTDDFRPLLVLNANCSDMIPLRAWPRDRYVELARRLLRERPDLRIAFTGAPAEAGPAERLVAEIGSDRCFCLAGRTSLRDLLVVFHHADVLVTNDSGPAHFASLTPIRVVTLFGPEHPAVFGSRSPRSHIIWRGLACSPCVSALNNRDTECTNNLCMTGIRVEEVHAVVTRLLDAGEPGGSTLPLPVVTRAVMPRVLSVESLGRAQAVDTA
jgi:ADP-heptose:LPS heptosyltransferase